MNTNTSTVTKAAATLAKLQARRDEIHAQLNEILGQVTNKRTSLGQAILDGKDLAALTDDIAHMDRQAAAMKEAEALAEQAAKDAQNAFNQAQQTAGRAEVADCEAEAKELYRGTYALLDQLEATAAEIEKIHRRASEAYLRLPLKGNQRGNAGGQVSNISWYAQMLRGKAGELRRYGRDRGIL
ncbi:MAG: hypothetical protein M1281_04745 [Chloroflexi bacterium]|nr:hypothetical protein [Chloroflexota bacterium]